MESSTIEQTPDMEHKFRVIAEEFAELSRWNHVRFDVDGIAEKCNSLHESALQPLRDELEECKNRFLLHEDSFKKWINSNQKTNAEMVAELERVKGERDALRDERDKWKGYALKLCDCISEQAKRLKAIHSQYD
jgi:hypothetical protein